MERLIRFMKTYPVEIGVVVLLLSMSRLFFFHYSDYARRSAEQHHLEYLDHTAMLAHHAIDRQVENLAYYFNTLSRMAAHRTPDDPSFAELADDLRTHVRAERSGVVQAGLIGPGGVLVWGAQGNAVLSGLDVSREEHFQVALASGAQMHVSTPQATTRGPRRWLIRFSRPVRNDEGSVLGVAVVSVAVDRMVRQLQTYVLRGEVISVFRSDGALLATTLTNYDDMLGWGLRTSRQPGAAGVFAGQDESVLSGDRRLVVLHAVESAPLMVSASTPLRGATQEFDAVSRSLLIAEICLGLLILGGGAVVLTVRTRSSANQALVQAQGAREQLARTLDAIDAYVFVAHISSSGNLVEEFSSQGEQRLFRTGSADEGGLQEFLERMNPPIGRDQRVSIAQELATGRNYIALSSYKRPSGEVIWLQLSISPMEIGHEAVVAVGLVVEVDETHAKRAEIARLQAAATSGLASELVRDLTQAMTSVALMADNCLGSIDHLPADYATPARERLERITRIALGTRSVVSSVRRYLQHQARDLDAVLVQDVLPFSLRLANGGASQGKIVLINNVPRDLPKVLANRAILEFMIVTVINNMSANLARLQADFAPTLEVDADYEDASDVVEIRFSCKLSLSQVAGHRTLPLGDADPEEGAAHEEFEALEVLSKAMWGRFAHTLNQDKCCCTITLRRAL